MLKNQFLNITILKNTENLNYAQLCIYAGPTKKDSFLILSFSL